VRGGGEGRWRGTARSGSARKESRGGYWFAPVLNFWVFSRSTASCKAVVANARAHMRRPVGLYGLFPQFKNPNRVYTSSGIREFGTETSRLKPAEDGDRTVL